MNNTGKTMQSVLVLVMMASVAVGISLAGAREAYAADAGLLGPPEIWKDYDPDKGDFEEKIIKEWDGDKIHFRDSYISAYVNKEKIRVYCRYAFPKGATRLPAMLFVHGWMGAPQINRDFVKNGYAVMTYDYCGKNGNRREYTKYPEALRYGNMARPHPVWAKSTDPRANSDYIWIAISRRVLSYLERQKDIDKDRIGASGYSYGGTLIWSLGADPRTKAVVSFHGVGWNVYWRDRAIWKYGLNKDKPAPNKAQQVYLAGIAPQAYAPYINCPALFLNGTNDHHGGHERGHDTLKALPKGIPHAVAHQARGGHDTEKLGKNHQLWLDKYVKGEDIVWPENPESEIVLGDDGMAEFLCKPASPEQVASVAIYYALKNPCSFNRNWRSTETVRRGNTWTARLPVMNVDDYLFGFANIRYKAPIVLSTDFEAVIPARLGKAVATDKPSTIIYQGKDGVGQWTPTVIPADGPGGIKGFRPSRDHHLATMQPSDPKWKAPKGAKLSFKVHSKTPVTFKIYGGDHWRQDIELPGSEPWQTIVVDPTKLVNRHDKRSILNDWSRADRIKFEGEIKELIFTDVKWQKHP
ncbi:MAG TPA: dienelactone hydrolase family protein [Phycisphaerae bacterium]|nr:dienelactone hydrolase family protein [Phycisphaerae bacterium]